MLWRESALVVQQKRHEADSPLPLVILPWWSRICECSETCLDCDSPIPMYFNPLFKGHGVRVEQLLPNFPHPLSASSCRIQPWK